jgi:uncharacterized protein
MPVLETDAEIRALLQKAKTIAVVGCSPDPSRDSHAIAVFLRQRGYRVLPVNPLVTSILGERSWPDLTHLPSPPDIVDIFRRPEHVPALVEEAIRTGAPAVWMQLGVGNAAAARQAAEAGLAVVVDRCILVEHRRLLPTGRTADRA